MTSPDDALPLGLGASSDAVVDLQQRLAELDFHVSDPPGLYGPQTAAAVSAFQRRRALEATGVCDHRTWREIVEAGYRLGSRLLYRRRPMQRGDDVAELQRRLSLLGFDPGRIDGIFGDQTADALRDFQRNAGLPADGICGRRTVDELNRVASREQVTQLVSSLHERLQISAAGTGTLSTHRFGVGEQGGFAAGAAGVSRALREVGAFVLETHDPSPSQQAQEANAAAVDCFISIVLIPERTSCTTAYYRGFRYESLASRELAELVQARLPRELGIDDGGTLGLALPILRETRMPAIEVQLGSVPEVVQRAGRLGEVLIEALSTWVAHEQL